jgi:hypothetical protein
VLALYCNREQSETQVNELNRLSVGCDPQAAFQLDEIPFGERDPEPGRTLTLLRPAHPVQNSHDSSTEKAVADGRHWDMAGSSPTLRSRLGAGWLEYWCIQIWIITDLEELSGRSETLSRGSRVDPNARAPLSGERHLKGQCRQIIARHSLCTFDGLGSDRGEDQNPSGLDPVFIGERFPVCLRSPVVQCRDRPPLER